MLDRHGVPATLYLATDFVDRALPFPDDGVALSWSALADMVASGRWQIESHTHTHALLDRLADDAIADELDRSIDLIGEHLGRRPEHFAYPKALAPSAAADQAVRARFRSAALAGTRVNRFGATDPWLLARTPIQLERRHALVPAQGRRAAWRWRTTCAGSSTASATPRPEPERTPAVPSRNPRNR